jgi:hypothetical protein
MAHKKKVKKGKTSERKTAKKGKSRKHHEPKKQTAKTKRRSAPGSRKSKSGSGARSKAPGGHRGKETSSYRYIPEWLRAKSERSKAAWRVRWDRGTAPIGKVGQKYIQDTYGPTITPSDFGPIGGGGGGVPSHGSVTHVRDAVSETGRRYQEEEQDDFEDYYDDFDFYDREY